MISFSRKAKWFVFIAVLKKNISFLLAEWFSRLDKRETIWSLINISFSVCFGSLVNKDASYPSFTHELNVTSDPDLVTGA